jgi:hypothetical protein
LDHMNEFGDEVHDGRRCNGGTHWIAVATWLFWRLIAPF